MPIVGRGLDAVRIQLGRPVVRVLFVFPDLSSDKTNFTGALSYGIALLSSELKAAGHEVALYHITSMPSREEFRENVGGAEADLVAFSSNSHYARRLRNWTAWTREETGAKIAVGGVHATLDPEDVCAMPGVEFVCVGEGDSALPELCEALEGGRSPSRVKNVWARNGGAFVKNSVRPFLQDLDALPDPDLSIFNFDNLYSTRRGVFPYIMSRGCAFHCTYCSAPAYAKLSPGAGRVWRFLTPGRAAAQLGRLVARHMPDAPLVTFLDSILFPHTDWLREFAPMYIEHVGKPFSCNLRPDFVTDEVAGILQTMGCMSVRLGVESGNEDMTARVLNRQLSVDDIRAAFTILRKHGIKRWAYNMVGLPGETIHQALDTVRLNAEIDPDLALSFMFYPYPGTYLRERCAAEGSLVEKEFDHYQIDSGTRSATFPRADVLFMHRFFARLVRAYSMARDWPRPLRLAWEQALTSILVSPLLPRGTIVFVRDRYKRLRHRVGEYLVRRSPRLYRALGGTDPL
jgi:anaerobic magnesium-protoporphyrin IX monomethyl ester cyclase